MAFKTKWECEYCGHIIIARLEPEEWECECYEKEEDSLPIKIELTQEEKNDRYKEQYRLNTYTWNGKRPEMFYGKLKNYPDRNYLKEK